MINRQKIGRRIGVNISIKLMIKNFFVNSTALKKLIAFLLLFVSTNLAALETSFQLHKADQSESYGVSVGVGDSFFKQKEFNWSISYNRLEDTTITWNGKDINFALDTVDLMLNYRYYPKSYNAFIKSLIVEFAAGVGVALTENKFTWSALEQEKYFSEPGDVNGVIGFLVHKKFNKELAMHIGVKHYPDYSEFGDISSVVLGFTFIFGSNPGY